MPPRVYANPRNDASFLAAIARLLPYASTPRDLQRLLRQHYPEAVVRARELSSEPTVVWYAYRDGRWVPSIGG
jgi:hypothetical protein